MQSSTRHYLLEANLFDKEPLITAITKILVDKNAGPEIQNWFAKQYLAWFISSTDDQKKPILPYRYRQDDPEWAKKPGISIFDPFALDYDQINHIIDYFNSLNNIDLKKINKEPYEMILKKVADWDLELGTAAEEAAKAKAVELIEDVDYKLVMAFPDGYKWIRLVSKKSYDVEGDQMGHCAASYADRASSVLYALKDPKGFSHVTIETSNRGIEQIKGKGNKAPVLKYWSYARAFIEKKDIVVISDGENIGMISWQSQYHFKDSAAWKEIWTTDILPMQKKEITELLSRVKDNKITGSVSLAGLLLEKLPDLSHISVSENFHCSYNQFTSLEGAPKSVGNDFFCGSNQLTNLEGAPKSVGGHFACNNNKLISLHGAPEYIGKGFYCSTNQLTNLEGAPEYVGANFECAENQLTSLQGAPMIVGGVFWCEDNPTKFTQEDIKAAMNARATHKESEFIDPLSMIYESVIRY